MPMTPQEALAQYEQEQARKRVIEQQQKSLQGKEWEWKTFLTPDQQQGRKDIVLTRLINASAPSDVIAKYMERNPESYQVAGMEKITKPIIEQVQAAEAQKVEQAQEKFKTENVNIQGTWMNRQDVDKLRQEEPYLWSVLNTSGYPAYLKAKRERKEKLEDISVRAKTKFESELKDQPDEFQKAYNEGGYEAYKVMVDDYNAKIEKEKVEFEKWLNKDAPTELKDVYFNAKSSGGDEIDAYNNAVAQYNNAVEVYKAKIESENQNRQRIIDDLKPYRITPKELNDPTINYMYFSTGGKSPFNYDIAKYLRKNEGNQKAEFDLLVIFDQKQIDDAKKYNYEYLGIGAPEHITWQEYWPDYFKEKGWPTTGIKDTNQFMNRLNESHKEYDKKYLAPMTLEQFERNYFEDNGWTPLTQDEKFIQAMPGGQYALGKISRDDTARKLQARNEYVKKFGWEPVVIQSLNNLSNAIVPGYYLTTNWDKISVPEKIVNGIFDVIFLASFAKIPLGAGVSKLKNLGKSALDKYLKAQKTSFNIALKEIGSSMEGILRTFGAEGHYATAFKTSYDKLLYAIERNDMVLFKKAADEISKLTSKNLSPKIQKMIRDGGQHIKDNIKTYQELIDNTGKMQKPQAVYTDKAVVQSIENTKPIWQKNIDYTKQQYKNTIDNLVAFYKKLQQQELDAIQKWQQEQLKQMANRNKKLFERMTSKEKDALIEEMTGKPEGYFKGKKDFKERMAEFEKEWKARQTEKQKLYETIEKQKAQEELKKWQQLTQKEQDAYLENLTRMEPGEFAKRKALRELINKKREIAKQREKLIKEIEAEKYEGELRTWRQMTSAQQDALIEKLTKMEPGEFNRRKLLREFIQNEKKAKANYNKLLDEIGKEKYEGEIRTWRQLTTAEKDAAIEKLTGKEPGYFDKKKATLEWKEKIKREIANSEEAYRKAMDEKLEGERRKVEQLTQQEKDSIIEKYQKIKRDIEKAENETEIRNTIDDIDNMLRGKRNLTPEEQNILDDIDDYLKGKKEKPGKPSKGGTAVKERTKTEKETKVETTEKEKVKPASKEEKVTGEKPDTIQRISPEILTAIGIPMKHMPFKFGFVTPATSQAKSPLFMPRKDLISELQEKQEAKNKKIKKIPQKIESKLSLTEYVKTPEPEKEIKGQTEPRKITEGKKPLKNIILKTTPKEKPEPKPAPEELPDIPRPPELKKLKEKKKIKLYPDESQQKKRREIKESLGAVTYRRGELNKMGVWHTYHVDKNGVLHRSIIVGPAPEGAIIATGKGSTTTTLKLIRGKKVPNFTVLADTGAVDDIISASGGKLTLSHVPDRISGGGMKRLTNGIGRLSPKIPKLR